MLKRMFILTFAVLGFAAVQAHATPIDKTTANTYYNNCMAQSDPRLTKESQQEMCACTSAQMMQAMTVEDLQALSTSKAAQNKMLTDVYAPCMSGPVRDMVTAECGKNPQVAASNASTICGCMAKLTGDWFQLSGRSLMIELINKDPNIVDPITPIMESPQFKQESMKNLQSCMANP